jgi:3-phenylpropionate/trans-cinnamate dioxygenase ferredoxin reductase subunit
MTENSVKDHVLIVGAGQAGGRTAQALRKCGFRGPVTLIGEESEAPYERPPLSKEVLRGEKPASTTALFGASFYEENRVTRRAGVRVEGIAPATGRAFLSDGSALPYDRLILSTGGRVRTLPFAPMGGKGIYYLRTIADSLALGAALKSARRLVVIGGGYLGLEVAASARKLGLDVTVVEMMPHLLDRVMAAEVADHVAAIHRDRGVRFHFGVGAVGVRGTDTLESVALADGTSLPADIVVVAIGIVPNVELAAAAGASIEDGIAIDAFGKTTLDGVYAAGDVANFHHPILGRRVRLESWQNAQNAPATIAAALCGTPAPDAEVPWFWSDQYEFNIQSVGVGHDTDTVVRRGDPGTGRFTCFDLADGVVVGATGFNRAADVRFARRMIAAKARPDIGALADPSRDLKDLAG